MNSESESLHCRFFSSILHKTWTETHARFVFFFYFFFIQGLHGRHPKSKVPTKVARQGAEAGIEMELRDKQTERDLRRLKENEYCKGLGNVLRSVQ